MSKKNISNKSRTDLGRLTSMKDAEIDLSDIPEIAPEKFAKAVARKGLGPAPKKAQITLRIDSDVLEWFSYASGHVPRLTKQYLGQEQYVQTGGQGRSFPVLPAREL